MDRIASLQQKSRRFSVLAVAFFVTLLALQTGYSEQNAALPDAAVESGAAPVAVQKSYKPFSKVAVGVTIGLLGPGLEVATPLTRKSNLRVDGTFFSYNIPAITASDFNFTGDLKLRDVRVSYDYFPFGKGFRVSGGVEVYNQFNLTANASAAPGTSVTLNSVDYYSGSGSKALAANASLIYGNKVAPTLTFGWGNIVPRNHHHITIPFELGAAYTGVPKFNLGINPNSSFCTDPNNPATCYSVSAKNQPAPIQSQIDTFNSNVAAEQVKINNDLKVARFYPILSTGFAYRF